MTLGRFISGFGNPNVNYNILGQLQFEPHGSSGTAILKPPQPVEVPDSSKGDCFTITTREDKCFSVSVVEEDCFKISSIEEEDKEIEPPSLINISGFKSVKDLIGRGSNSLIVLGRYEPSSKEPVRPVVAIVDFLSNDVNNLTKILGVTAYKNLDSYDEPIELEEASLEAFDTDTSIKNFAIRTSTQMIYIESTFLNEKARVENAFALAYPFAHTDDSYWTALNYSDGTTKTYSGDADDHRMYLKQDSHLGLPITHSYDEVIGKMRLNVTEGYMVNHEDYSNYSMAGAKPLFADPYIGVYWLGSQGTSYSVGMGNYTTSRDINNNSDINILGSNSFITPVKVLANQDYEVFENPDNPGKWKWSIDLGVKAQVSPFPTEVDITSVFLNIRPNIAFGDGFFVVGEVLSKTVNYQWENRKGNFYNPIPDGIVYVSNHAPWLERNGGHLTVTGGTDGADFYLAPFTEDNTQKVQTTSRWFVMGTSAIDSSYSYVVENLPAENGITGAVVGDRCIIPLETPTEGGDGIIYILSQEYDLNEHKTATTPVIFPS